MVLDASQRKQSLVVNTLDKQEGRLFGRGWSFPETWYNQNKVWFPISTKSNVMARRGSKPLELT
jgi:hypothetical protein